MCVSSFFLVAGGVVIAEIRDIERRVWVNDRREHSKVPQLYIYFDDAEIDKTKFFFAVVLLLHLLSACLWECIWKCVWVCLDCVCVCVNHNLSRRIQMGIFPGKWELLVCFGASVEISYTNWLIFLDWFVSIWGFTLQIDIHAQIPRKRNEIENGRKCYMKWIENCLFASE